jgi:hypothetical protein
MVGVWVGFKLLVDGTAEGVCVDGDMVGAAELDGTAVKDGAAVSDGAAVDGAAVAGDFDGVAVGVAITPGRAIPAPT